MLCACDAALAIQLAHQQQEDNNERRDDAAATAAGDGGDVTEDHRSQLEDLILQPDVNALAMTLVVLSGAALVGILIALVQVVEMPPLFSLRFIAGNEPALKMFDRIEEFH